MYMKLLGIIEGYGDVGGDISPALRQPIVEVRSTTSQAE